MKRVFVRVVLIVATACHASSELELGACDVESAYRVVFQAPAGATRVTLDDVRPMYLGQALLTQHCAASGCHAADRAFYDLSPACPAGCCDEEECRRTARRVCEGSEDPDCAASYVSRATAARRAEQLRLSHHRSSVIEHRQEIWRVVATGEMPLSGATPLTALFAEHDGTEVGAEVPGFDAEESREALRDWLACGAPVVERAEPGFPGVWEECDSGGTCIRQPTDVRVPEPTWPSIFAEVVEPFCARCHQERCVDDCALLVFSERFTTYMTLRDELSRHTCNGSAEPEPLLTRGSALESRFYVAIADPCIGHYWRLREEVLVPIQTWIDAGAYP